MLKCLKELKFSLASVGQKKTTEVHSAMEQSRRKVGQNIMDTRYYFTWSELTGETSVPLTTSSILHEIYTPDLKV